MKNKDKALVIPLPPKNGNLRFRLPSPNGEHRVDRHSDVRGRPGQDLGDALIRVLLC